MAKNLVSERWKQCNANCFHHLQLNLLAIRKQCPLSADYLLSLVILHVVGMDYKIGDLDPSILDNTTLKAVASSLDVTFALDTLESMTANTLGLRSVAFCQGSSESSLPKLAMNGKAAALISLLDVFPITTATMVGISPLRIDSQTQ